MIVRDKARFQNNIDKTIEECSFLMYAVMQNRNVKCTCAPHATKQPLESCKKCLGTGHKIRIKRIKGAVNESIKGGTALGVMSSYTTKQYFINKKYGLTEDDLLIDDNEVYYIHRIMKMRALQGDLSHLEMTGIKKKNGHDTILKNFKDIIANNS